MGRRRRGRFEGAWSAAVGGYAGTYDVTGGKQHVAIPDCIEYFIAPRGTWELLPVGAHVPETVRHQRVRQHGQLDAAARRVADAGLRARPRAREDEGRTRPYLADAADGPRTSIPPTCGRRA